MFEVEFKVYYVECSYFVITWALFKHLEPVLADAKNMCHSMWWC